MAHCHDEPEGKAISAANEQRIRELLDPATTLGRVCLRMLDNGEPIGRTCIAEGTEPHAIMAEWHQLTDENNILSVDGRRPCISVLASAWERRWANAEQGMWAPVDPNLAPNPLTRPFGMK